MLEIVAGTRLVLPSPNGATLTLATGDTPTFAGCLRNSRAVAAAAMQCGKHIAVIPAGERWPEDESCRFAVEDMIGAGAIISHLTGRLSPKAQMAVGVYQQVRGNLLEIFTQCGSGKELRERGFEGDVVLAAEVDVEDCAPRLRDGTYVKAEQGTARAKVSPKPWNWEKSHEIGCCYPVGAYRGEVQVPPDQSLASRSVAKSTCKPSNGSAKLDGTRK
jgi:phosphosulfolactate phosphohydrolase-like enzyme